MSMKKNKISENYVRRAHPSELLTMTEDFKKWLDSIETPWRKKSMVANFSIYIRNFILNFCLTLQVLKMRRAKKLIRRLFDKRIDKRS